jgi:hypothetical protein
MSMGTIKGSVYFGAAERGRNGKTVWTSGVIDACIFRWQRKDQIVGKPSASLSDKTTSGTFLSSIDQAISYAGGTRRKRNHREHRK